MSELFGDIDWREKYYDMKEERVRDATRLISEFLEDLKTEHRDDIIKKWEEKL